MEKLFRWTGEGKILHNNKPQKIELFIYAHDVEHAREIYGRKKILDFDELIKTNNYIEDDSEGLRMLLHWRMKGRQYFYTPTIMVMYIDNDYKPVKKSLAQFLGE